jgi:alpha-glucoside transport system permease protein
MGTGGALDLTNPVASSALAAAVILALLAIFSTLRGVIWNNLWWVAAVAGLATIFGLALAVLADRSRSESAAKTLIFMPMAISLVGAAIIWKYIYDTPGAGQAEGLLNVLWPGGPIDFLRGTTPTGTISPWNNFFIMIIMIWIQAGFAMVVISAAIKGVPTELLEAARVDGANEVQVFWRVTLPQVMSTLAVVVTTLTITVLKIFDLVKATTGGAAGTDVLANRMYENLRNGAFTSSSTFAVMILILVLPVMYFNIRRVRKAVDA